MNILFVCSVNVHRSKTAEHIFSSKFKEKISVKSCGTMKKYIEEHKDFLTKDSIPISEKLCLWADRIYCMEDYHLSEIEKMYGHKISKKCYVLNIPDIFVYMNETLCKLLEERLTEIGIVDTYA